MTLRRLIALVTLASVAITSLPANEPASAQSAPQAYAGWLAAAQKAAAEKSWIRARDAYAQIIPLVPDENARRWAELWLLDASWRAEDTPNDWQAQRVWTEKYTEAYARLLQSYVGQPRDERMAAILTSRADFSRRTNDHQKSSEDLIVAADILAEATPTPEAKARYLSFVRQISQDFNAPDWMDFDGRLSEHLDRAAALTSDAYERGWFTLRVASRHNQNHFASLASRAARWAAALRATQGTPFETQAKAHEFIFRIETGYDRMATSAAPLDLPAGLAEARTLLAALKTDAGDQKDLKPLEEKLHRFEREWSEPWLLARIPDFLRPGEPLSLVYGATGYTQLTATLYRHSLDSWVDRKADAAQDRQAQRKADPEGKERDDLRALAEKLHRSATKALPAATLSLPASPALSWHTGALEISPATEPGFYTLEINATGDGYDHTLLLDVVVTSVQAIAVISPAKRVSLHIYQAGDGRPVADRPLQTIISDLQETRVAWSGRLDAAGMVDAPLPTHPESKWQIANIAALAGDQPLLVDNLRYGSLTSTALVADLILDRELYRPGETVYWKLIVREFTAGRFTVPATQKTLRMRFSQLAASAGESLKEVSVVLNAFGTAHGSLVIPPTARPGPVEIQLENPVDDDAAILSRAFDVDNYVHPPVEAQVTLASAADTLRPGAEITVRVQAAYYSGGPVTAAPVTLTCSAYWGEPTQEDEERPWDRSTREKWRDELAKKSFTSLTDVTGGADFRIPLPSFVPTDTMLSLDASVTPAGSLATDAQANWQVTKAGLRIAADTWLSAKAARPGESVDFTCRVVDGRSLPAPFKGVACLVELRWNEAWLNPAGEVVTGAALQTVRREYDLPPDGDLPNPWQRLHADYSSTVVDEKFVQAKADGQIQVSFTPEHAGIYQLQLKSADHVTVLTLPARSHSAQHWPLTLIAADEATSSLPIRPGTHLIAPENAVAGQTQQFLGILPEGSSTGLFALAGAEGLITRRVTFSGCMGWITIDQPLAQGAEASAWLTPLTGGGSTATANFSVRDPAQRLTLTLQPQAQTTRPGSEVTVALTASHPTKQPALAEVAISVSDESVNALTGRREQSPDFWNNAPQAFLSLTKHPQTAGHFPVAELSDPRPGVHFVIASDVLSEMGVTTLAPFEATMDKDYGYLKTNSVTATRIGRDVPIAISVVSREFASITLRRVFSSTAAWEPTLTTDAAGQAQFKFRYPDNLTRWRIEAYAVGRDGNSFGRASVFTETSLPFQARLQTPRFLTVGDTADLSAVLVNRTDVAQSAAAQLTVEGGVQLAVGNSPEHDRLSIPAQGEARAAWHTQATTPGEAQLTLKARSAAESDGMALVLPVQPDGFWQKTAASARLAGNARRQVFDLDLPSPLDPQRVQVELKLSPGVYPALLDALPYLIDYPYGCVEQTINRFLPAVVVRKTLVDFGLDAAAVEKRILTDESPFAATRREKSAGLTKLDDVVQASLARLAEARLFNGAFGWWPDQRSPDAWMTAYVVWGLSLARESGVAIPGKLEEETASKLCSLLPGKSLDPGACAWVLAALSRTELSRESRDAAQAAFVATYAARDQLSAHGRASLALAAATFGTADQRSVLLRNLENGAQRATAAGVGDTVHWGSTGNYWRAVDGAVETTALTLLALLKLDPTHLLVEPAANWLLLNRRSSGWTNTRDTAFAVLALTAYAEIDHQSTPAEEVEIHANGRLVGAINVTPDSVFASKLTLSLPPKSLQPGKNHFELRRLSGKTTLYALALTSAWTDNTTVKPAGHLVEAARQFERQQTTPTLAGTLRLVPVPLDPGMSAKAGEKITAIVTLTVPNELEYLMVEVPKPAGCEPFNPLSGWDAFISPVPAKVQTGAAPSSGAPIYREEHDDRSVFFLNHVQAGTWEIRFALRATTPGDYRAAPVKVEAMYAPEIRANTDARRVKIAPRD